MSSLYWKVTHTEPTHPSCTDLVEVEVSGGLTGVGHVSRDIQTLLQTTHLSEQLQPPGQHVVHTPIPEKHSTLHQSFHSMKTSTLTLLGLISVYFLKLFFFFFFTSRRKILFFVTLITPSNMNNPIQSEHPILILLITVPTSPTHCRPFQSRGSYHGILRGNVHVERRSEA